MADELISFTMPIAGREVAFSFKKMTAETAAGIISRLKARWNYHEVVRRELLKAEQTPIHQRDEHLYMALLEKQESVKVEMAKGTMPLLNMIAAPDKKVLSEIMSDEKQAKEFQNVLERYFQELFPSEEDRKKS